MFSIIKNKEEGYDFIEFKKFFVFYFNIHTYVFYHFCGRFKFDFKISLSYEKNKYLFKLC